MAEKPHAMQHVVLFGSSLFFAVFSRIFLHVSAFFHFQFYPPPLGPFEKGQQHTLDKWLGTFTRVDIQMGDFNDKIWEQSHEPTRWWRTKLSAGSLQDPAMAVAEDISPQ